MTKPVTNKAVLSHLKKHPLQDSTAARLVFLNGCYAPKLSNISSLPKGLCFLSYKEAIKKHTKMAKNGVFCYLPKGTVVCKPLHLLFLTTENRKTQLQNFLVLDSNSQACIYEEHTSLLSTTIQETEIIASFIVGDNAKLDYIKLHHGSSKDQYKGETHVTALANSQAKIQHLFLDGGKIEEKLHIVLEGEQAESSVQSMSWLNGKRYANFDVEIEHKIAKTVSQTLYKSIANDQAHSSFRGKIFIAKNAMGCEGLLKNHNLLLSNKAQIDTLPELEIYNDDVKCSHGSTVGDLDEQALFYLASRGIAKQDARAMLLYAFLEEIVDKIDQKIIKEYLKKLLRGKLQEIIFL
ncbi:MAG: Fe-S cluster assembly protein SufD [Gammaproteobacteria bacterium]